MTVSNILGRRHIRFTRTVKAEVQGKGIAADLVLEGEFPLDFEPDRHVLELLQDKGNGVVTIQLRPKPPEGSVILNAGAAAVAITNPATLTEWVDLDAELEGQMTDERAKEIAGALILPESQHLDTPTGKAALLGGAADRPLRRF